MFHVVDLQRGRIVKTYNTRGWARREQARLITHADTYFGYTKENLVVMPTDEYMAKREEIDPYVEVKNLINGNPVMIRKSQVGTCCDPSTETYWSM